MSKRRERGGCLGRIVGLALAAVLVAVPVTLLLPDAVVGQVLAAIFPGVGLNLTDPALVDTWRCLIGTLAGVVVALLLALLGGLARAGRRRRRDPADVLERLRQATRLADSEALRACAEELSAGGGADAVPALSAALEVADDELTRQALAAALYRVGRAVTAEVSLRAPRI